MSESSKANVPFPPSGGYVDAIRASAHALRESSGVIISSEAIARFLHAPAFSLTFNRLSKNHGLALPLNFPSLLSELNVISVLALLNFGSGYRVPLHAYAGRGAWDSIRALVLALFITSSAEGDMLSAQALKGIAVDKVAELTQLPTHVERPHDSIPGVVVGERGGPLYELISLITTTLNETGDILLSQGYPDLGSFVLEALRAGQYVGRRRGGGVDVDVVIEKIVLAIPAFRDMALVDGKPVYIFKKALFLLHAISLRFSNAAHDPTAPGAIPVPDTSGLPVFSDNVLPSMLVHLGIIELAQSTCPSLAEAFRPPENVDSLLGPPAEGAPAARGDDVPGEGPVLTEQDAYILRASAIDACERIVREARNAACAAQGPEWSWLGKVTLPELDAWLWAGAKDRRDYRALVRFAVRNTVYF